MTARDPYWLAAAEALRGAAAPAEAILAPDGFAAYLPGVRAYGADAALPPQGAEAGWLVVHKDHLARLPLGPLAALLVESRLIFANEVFGVFALAPAERRADPHVESFLAGLRAREGGTAPEPEPAGAPRPRWLRWLVSAALLRPAASPAPTVRVEIAGGLEFALQTGPDTPVSGAIRDRGHYQPQVTRLMRALLRPGDTLLDVGADIGWFTVIASRLVGPAGRVLAVEPDPRAARLLRANIRRNRGANVTVLEAASLPLQPLDALLAGQAARIDLARVDAGGAEVAVLRGMAGVRAAHPKLRLICRFWPFGLNETGASAAELAAVLDGWGSGLWLIAADGSARAIAPGTLIHLADDEYTPQSGRSADLVALAPDDAEAGAVLRALAGGGGDGVLPSTGPAARMRPATALADTTEIRAHPSRFDREMPEADPGRLLLRKWWEWDYLADCAERLGLLAPGTQGVGLGVGIESLIYYFARHCGRIVATDLYSADTSWREARYADFREAVQRRSPFALPEGRLIVENADMRALPVATASQDFAWSTSSIEHVPTLTSLIEVYAELARVLKPGGYALLTTEFCLSESPYLLPHLNAMDGEILPRLFAAISPWLEPVGPLDLTPDWRAPANGCGARRYLKPGMIAALHDARFDALRTGQAINPVGISAICPVGFVLRRTAAAIGPFPGVAELGLPPAIPAYTEGLDRFHAGENEAAAALLLPIAGAAANSLQLRLHAFRFGIDAELRAGREAEAAARDILAFLASLPAHATSDADCSDLFSHVMRMAGLTAEAVALARAGALSASTVWDQALRLAARAEALAETPDRLLVAVARDLILGGWAPQTILAQCRVAAEAEGLAAAALDPIIGEITADSRARISLIWPQ